MNNHFEDEEQKALFQWALLFDEVGPYLFAIPNGGKRNPREAARLKAQGVKAGVHDILLPRARGGCHGLWIEMKYGKNDLSEKQADWKVLMDQEGYKTVTCWSWQEAVEEIEKYLELTNANKST